MRKIEQRLRLCTVLLLLFILGMCYFLFLYKRDSGKWYVQSFNKHLYSDSGELLSGTIVDRNGVLLSTVNGNTRVYSYNPVVRKATLHVIGDSERKIGTGAVQTMREYMLSYDRLSGANSLSEQGNTVMLSVDSEACAAAYNAMGDAVGCVGVYNYKTGEILCLLSTPTFDPKNIPEDLETSDKYDGVYVNRFLSSTFAPGSTFKTVTLQAALETLPDLENRTFVCEGTLRLGDNKINCTKAHGAQTLAEAYANSCNCVFASLAAELGGDILSDYTSQAGLTSSYRFSGCSTAKGTFELVSASTNQLGWAGVGLYHDLVNPCSLMVYMGAVANGGAAAVPTLLRSVTKADGTSVAVPDVHTTGALIQHATANKLASYMIYNVQNVYGAERFPNVRIGAKSGTIEQKTGLSNCWFAGFVDSEQYPYAFVVFMEQAGSGNRVAGAVAAAVLHSLIPLP